MFVNSLLIALIAQLQMKARDFLLFVHQTLEKEDYYLIMSNEYPRLFTTKEICVLSPRIMI